MKKNQQIVIKTILNLGILIFFGRLLVSCSLNSNFASQVSDSEENIDLNQDLSNAIQKTIEFGKNYPAVAENSDRQTEVVPVSYQELIEYLPQSPRGWTAEKPKGQTSSFGNYSISQVEQSYSKQDKLMTVSIFDCAFNSALYAPFLLSTEFSQESTEGYNKGIKIDDIPGRESYKYSSRKGSLNLLIDRRFLVKIDGNNIEEDELKQWWHLLDRQSLSKLN